MAAAFPTRPNPPIKRDQFQMPGRKDQRAIILVAADQFRSISDVDRWLRGRYWVVEARGSDILHQTRKVLPDLALLELDVWLRHGCAFGRAIREDPRLDLLPVIVLSSETSPASRIEALREGADDVLTRPLQVSELWVRIDNLIAVRRRFRQHLQRAAAAASPAALSAPAGREDRLLAERIVQAIDLGLVEEGFEISQLARRARLARSHLYRRVKDLFGCTPGQLIKERRLACAASLLVEGEASVTEVAFVVGFKSAAHFSRCFRRRFGRPPSEYRKRGVLAG